MCPFCHYSPLSRRNICTDPNNNAIGVVEYELYCGKCRKSIALFSYGEWFLNFDGKTNSSDMEDIV